jgi:hypothetical protein
MNQSLKDEIAQLKDKTKYLCRKRGNIDQEISNACKGRFKHEWRESQYHFGRQQGSRQYNRNKRY